MPTGYTISRNGFKAWLNCKYCGEPFLALPKYQDSAKCCSVSHAQRLRFQGENCRKLQSDLMKRRRSDPTSDFNRNNAKAVGDHLRNLNKTQQMRDIASKRIAAYNQTDKMRDVRSRYMIDNMSKKGCYISPHHRKLYNNLSPFLDSSALEIEVFFDMVGTRFSAKYNQRWIRVDLLHRISGIIIEIDGNTHYKIIEKDECRDEVLNEQGYVVKRVRNEAIDENVKDVALSLLDLIVAKETELKISKISKVGDV